MLQAQTANDLAKQLGVGGAIFLVAFGMLLKYRPWEAKNGNPRSEKSGEKSPEYWREQFREVINEALDAKFKERDENIRRIVREEIRRP